MRKHLWIGLLVAGVCLYYAFRGVSFSQLVGVLAHGRPLPILLALSLYIFGYLLRSERWAVLIKPIRTISASSLFWPMVIGFFANNVLPFRMGELVRAHICGRKFKISRAASLGTILLERICDSLAFLTTFLVASLFYPFNRDLEKGAWLLGGGCILVLVLLVLIRQYEGWFHAALDRCPVPASWKTRFKNLTIHFIHSTSGITQPRYVIEAMAFSLVIWSIEGTFLYLMAHAFAVDIKYGQAFFLLLALGLSVTLPQAPGYVGTYELFGVTALGFLGIPKNQGLPLILAIHGMQFLFIATLGTFALWREGLSFSHIVSVESEQE